MQFKVFSFKVGGEPGAIGRAARKAHAPPEVSEKCEVYGENLATFHFICIPHLHKDCFPLKGCLVSGSVCTWEN